METCVGEVFPLVRAVLDADAHRVRYHRRLSMGQGSITSVPEVDCLLEPRGAVIGSVMFQAFFVDFVEASPGIEPGCKDLQSSA